MAIFQLNKNDKGQVVSIGKQKTIDCPKCNKENPVLNYECSRCGCDFPISN